MACVNAFDHGALMLRNMSAPFLNASDVRWTTLFSAQGSDAKTGGYHRVIALFFSEMGPC